MARPTISRRCRWYSTLSRGVSDRVRRSGRGWLGDPTARPTVPESETPVPMACGATRDPDTGALLGCGDAGAGPLTTRRPSANGKVLGPYLELKDESIIDPWGPIRTISVGSASIDPSSNASKVFPGDAGYDRNAPKVIVDAWGTPIRYYRRAYPQGTFVLRATHTVGGHRQYTADAVRVHRASSIRDRAFAGHRLHLPARRAGCQLGRFQRRRQQHKG